MHCRKYVCVFVHSHVDKLKFQIWGLWITFSEPKQFNFLLLQGQILMVAVLVTTVILILAWDPMAQNTLFLILLKNDGKNTPFKKKTPPKQDKYLVSTTTHVSRNIDKSFHVRRMRFHSHSGPSPGWLSQAIYLMTLDLKAIVFKKEYNTEFEHL